MRGIRSRLFVSGVAVLACSAAWPSAVSSATASPTITTQGTTLAQVQAQAAAESMRGGQMKSMMMSGPATTAAVTTVQGPTNLAKSVGGSWNNYAFTLPSAPHAAGANGSAGAVHAVQLYNGKVLIMAGSGNQWQNLQAGYFTTWLWTPTATDQTKAWKFIPTPSDMFCAGHTILPNGNVLVAGGTTAYPEYDADGAMVRDFSGSKQAYVFDVAGERYVQTGSMANARWYPTALTLGSGATLVTSGLDDQAKKLGVTMHYTDTTEVFLPSSGRWITEPTLDFSLTNPSNVVAPAGPNKTRTLPTYAGLTLLANGSIFYSGASSGNNGVSPGIWNYKTGTFTRVGELPYKYQRNGAATVLLPPAQSQKIMVMGGGDYSQTTTSDTEIMNLSNVSSPATLKWTKGPAMSAAKMYVGAVTLPDATVFETNGAGRYRQGGVHTAEIYSPTTNKFTVMNSPTEDRLYHSNAFLEPNGQVAIMGSQALSGAFNMHIAIYSPPYLYKGTRPAVSGTAAFTYTGKPQGSFRITLAKGTTLGKVSLIRPSATTHSTDPDQRLVQLRATRLSNGLYALTPPANPSIAPPGQYMLFVTDSRGVPSVADWVSIGAPKAR